MLDAFDQAGLSNFNAGNNVTSNFNNHTSLTNVYGQTYFYNGNNFTERNYPTHLNRNYYEATSNNSQQNVKYNRGPGFNVQHHRNNSPPYSNNMARYEGRNFAPAGHIGTKQAHDNRQWAGYKREKL